MSAAKNKSLTPLFRKFPLRRYEKGNIILRPDDPPTGLYYVIQGYIKEYSIADSGEERLHIIYKTKEVFPVMWALKGINNNVYYESLTDCTLYKATKKEFLEFIKTNNDALSEVIKQLVDYLDIFTERIDSLEISKSYHRLVSRLIDLSKRFGTKNGRAVHFDLPITQQSLADSSAMTRETASRDFEELEKKGLVVYSEHTIIIKDIKKLEKELTTALG